MPDRVAADHHRVPCGLGDRAVEPDEDLGTGPGAVAQRPAGEGEFGGGVGREPAEDVVRREVVFDESVPPAPEPRHVLGDRLQRHVERGIEGEAGVPAQPGADGGGLGPRQQWPEPQPWAGAGLRDPGGQVPHVVEDARQSGVPGAAGRGAAALGPAVVDHAVRAHGMPVRVLHDRPRVPQHRVGVEVAAVGVVPVVAADDGADGGQRVRAHGGAERLVRGERGRARGRHDHGHVHLTLARQHGQTTAADVRPEGDTALVDRPGAQRTGPGPHTPPGGRAPERPAGDERVPGQRAVGSQRAPLEVAVATLPRVAQDAGVLGGVEPPAQHDPGEALCTGAGAQP